MSFCIHINTTNLKEISELLIQEGSQHIKLDNGSWLVGQLRHEQQKNISNESIQSKSNDIGKLKTYLDSICYQYFAVFYSEPLGQLFLLKDFTGCEAGYYKITSSKIIVSDNVNSVLNATDDNQIDEMAAFNFIYFEMPWKPQSLFKDIYSALNDTVYCFDKQNNSFTLQDYFKVQSTKNCQTLTLRDSITAAHEKRLSTDNAIFLSGGIDSQVMAIALRKDLGTKNLSSYNFSIKGAKNSEHAEAKQTANRLGIDFEHVEVDPKKEIDFEKLFLEQNSPYVGSIPLSNIFSKVNNNRNVTFFGGQDTRLHTPSLTQLDLLYWQFNSIIGSASKPILNTAGKLGAFTLMHARRKERTEKFDRLIRLVSNLSKPQNFLAYRHFHIHQFDFINEKLATHGALNELKAILSNQSFSTPRDTYNKIVELNWRKQYMFDIEYMVGNCRGFGFDCVMPFYDKELAQFSANIDFDLATKITKGRAGHSNKQVRVNKFALREAYKGELDDSLIYRDKAVCPTTYMFFNGALKASLNDFIYNNPLVGTELGEAIYINELIALAKKKHQSWKPEDNAILVVIFNAIVISQYYKKIQS